MDDTSDNKEISLENYKILLSKANPTNADILLGDIVLSEFVFFVQNTINDSLLVHLLEYKLLTDPEFSKLKAVKTSEDTNTILYREILNKRVECKKDYENLLKALCSTGNTRIAKKILEELRTRQFNPSSSSATRSSANASNSPADHSVQSNEFSKSTSIILETAGEEASPVNQKAHHVIELPEIEDKGQPNTDGNNPPADPPETSNNFLESSPFIPFSIGREDPPDNQNRLPIGAFLKANLGKITLFLVVLLVVGIVGAMVSILRISNAKDDQPYSNVFVPTETNSRNQPERYVTLSKMEDMTSMDRITYHPKNSQLSIGTPSAISIVKDDQLSSNLLQTVPTDTTTTQTHDQPEGYVTLPEMQDPASLYQVTHHPKKIWLSIGDPLDSPNLPKFDEIYLTINNSRGVLWENWLPQNADKVILLRLNETFTIPEIRHFLTIMSNVITIYIHNLNGALCRRNFKQESMETSIELYQSTPDVSGAGYMTRPSKIIRLTIGAPTDKPNLPESDGIHLVICNSEGVWWKTWFPINSDKVTSLKLNGVFSPSDIRHFLSVMNNLTTLCVDTMIGKLCDKTSG